MYRIPGMPPTTTRLHSGWRGTFSSDLTQAVDWYERYGVWKRLNVFPAWAVTTGARPPGVYGPWSVGHVGCHPMTLDQPDYLWELKPKVDRGEVFSRKDASVIYTGEYGDAATHVMSGEASYGTRGIAFGAPLAIGSFCWQKEFEEEYEYNHDVEQGLLPWRNSWRYVRDQGARVVALSFWLDESRLKAGSFATGSASSINSWYEELNGAMNAGLLLVAPAHVAGGTLRAFPFSSPYSSQGTGVLLRVGGSAMNSDEASNEINDPDYIADKTSVYPSNLVDVVVPGFSFVKRLATLPPPTPGVDDGYLNYSTQANIQTNVVAAVAHLVRSANPDLTAAQIADVVLATVDRPLGGGPRSYLDTLTKYTSAPHHKVGVPDAERAVLMAKSMATGQTTTVFPYLRVHGRGTPYTSDAGATNDFVDRGVTHSIEGSYYVVRTFGRVKVELGGYLNGVPAKRVRLTLNGQVAYEGPPTSRWGSLIPDHVDCFEFDSYTNDYWQVEVTAYENADGSGLQNTRVYEADRAEPSMVTPSLVMDLLVEGDAPTTALSLLDGVVDTPYASGLILPGPLFIWDGSKLVYAPLMTTVI